MKMNVIKDVFREKVNIFEIIKLLFGENGGKLK